MALDEGGKLTGKDEGGDMMMADKAGAAPGPIRDGWYWCECGSKLAKIFESTVVVDAPIYCRKCRKYHYVVIVNGKLMRPA